MPTEFKDLFVKQRAPKDYVTFPPQEVPTLEKFFAERTPKPAPQANMFGEDFLSKEESGGKGDVKSVARPISPEVQAVADAAPKTSPEKLAEIKAMFKTEQPMQEPSMQQPTMQEPSQPQEQLSSRSDLIDVSKVRAQADELAPKASWGDVAMGLIPVAMDALSGGYGDALDVSGKYYTDKASGMEKRKQSLEDKLMEIEKSRAIASAKGGKGEKNFQSVNIVDNATGAVLKANFDKNTGNYYSPDGKLLNSDKIQAGYSVTPDEWSRRAGISQVNKKEAMDYTPRLDPNTLELSRATPEGMVPIGPQREKLNNKQQKDLTQLTDKFITSDLYKKTSATLSAAGNIDSLLQLANSNNSSAANSARVQIARMSGEVGALSDMDIQSTGGSPSIKNKIRRFANLQATGNPLTPKDIADLREMADVYEKVARTKLNTAVDALESTYVNEFGGLKGAIGNKLKAYIPKGRQATSKKMPPPGLTFEQFKQWKKQNE